MKTKIILTLFIVCTFFCIPQAFPQDISNLIFINELADKDEITFEEGVRFFVLTIGKRPQSYKKNLRTLQKGGILEGIDSDKDTPIRKGTLALMIARHLDLKDHLLFKIFKFKRYAFKACVANGIMHYNASEWDRISGGEMIEIMNIVSEMSGGKK